MNIPKNINEIQLALNKPQPLLFNTLKKRLNVKTFLNETKVASIICHFWIRF